MTEKPADWTKAFKLEISSLADLYDVLLHGQFWVKNESKVAGRIREGDVVRAKSNESGRGTLEGFKEDEKGKRRASVLLSFSLSWFFVIDVFVSSVHALSSLVRLVTSLRGVGFWSCVSSANSWCFTECLAMISERGTGRREWAPVLNPEAHRTWAVMVTKTSYWLKWTDICLRGMTETIGLQ